MTIFTILTPDGKEIRESEEEAVALAKKIAKTGVQTWVKGEDGLAVVYYDGRKVGSISVIGRSQINPNWQPITPEYRHSALPRSQKHLLSDH